MGISSNSIIHFTNSLDSIKGILKQNFNLKYCKEHIKFSGKKATNLLVPMVSFCDIPMSEIKDHIDKYGSYGIGLTKNWARKNGLNPVLYIDKESSLNESLLNAITKFIIDADNNPRELHELSDDENHLLDILRYVKNYQEDLVRKSGTIPNYRFYDEREWRYVPNLNESIPCCIHVGTNDSYKVTLNNSKEELSKLKLTFEPDDISYLIIKDDDDIHELIRYFQEVKGDTYSYKAIERLTTRILTTSQIKGDF